MNKSEENSKTMEDISKELDDEKALTDRLHELELSLTDEQNYLELLKTFGISEE